MPQFALGSHGTIVRRNGSVIGELGDMSGPGLSRNEFDATSHNRDIDTWVMGVLRREPITLPIFFNKNEPTHGITSGLLQAIKDNSFDEYRVEFPDGSIWLGSGFCRNIVPTLPVDGLMSASVTIRLSGPMMIDGILFGADAI